MKLRIGLLVLASGACLAACMPTGAGHRYIVDGQGYTSSEQALAAMERSWEAKRAEVRPLPQVASSILVCAPSDAALGRPPYHKVEGGGTVSAEALAYAVAANRKQFEHHARVLERARLFAEVAFTGTDDCLGAARGRGVEYALAFSGNTYELIRLADGARSNVTAPAASEFAFKVSEFARSPGPAAPAPGQAAPLLAVMNVELASAGFRPELSEPVTDYLATKLAEGGKLRVVPRGQLRAQLGQEKASSYQACFDQACQIELGKALAAELVLAVKVVRLGSACSLTGSLFDLKTEATLRAAAVDLGSCTEDALQQGAAELARRLGE
ncbi:MAG TPA: hypothetical protein PK668_07745 [Myxococcota bacterium]|nr:hypothetical protein [Myxococcota bacterium]HRY93134.1 hypothetical protein [Myxococcota bacterium]